jgi:Flp pilus assembly protein TadB
VTFDAILKAGDNLQADYDQLHSQKKALHQQLVKLAQEKEEVAISSFPSTVVIFVVILVVIIFVILFVTISTTVIFVVIFIIIIVTSHLLWTLLFC